MSEKHESAGTADERLETDFGPFDENTGRSRMAREAKIGLAVIFILLVIFGVVLYNRLTGADESPEASAGATTSEAEGGGQSASQKSEPGSTPANWGQSTIAAAQPGSDEALPGALSTNEERWGGVDENSEPTESDVGATPQLSPPSFMPNLVEATPSGRYSGDARVGGSEAAGSAGPLLPTTQANPIRPPGLQPTSDPHQSSPSQENPLRGQTATDSSTWSTSQTHETQTIVCPPSPHSTYRATPDSPEAKEPVDASVGAPSQSDGSQTDASAGASSPNEATRQWASGANAAGSSARLSYASSQTAVSGSPGQQHAAAGSTSKDGTYVIQPNDSYWVISEKLYGTGAYFRALAQHNRTKIPDENRLRVGDTIQAPDVSALEKAYPDLCPKPAHRAAAERRTLLTGTQRPIGAGRVYVVQEGDNLFDIARYELGRATRWTEIVDLNKNLLGADLNDLDYLSPGMRLVLPDDEPAARVAQEPNSLYQR